MDMRMLKELNLLEEDYDRLEATMVNIISTTFTALSKSNPESALQILEQLSSYKDQFEEILKLREEYLSEEE